MLTPDTIPGVRPMSARHADGAPGAPGPDALQGFVELQPFGLGGRKLVFDSGLVALDDPRITAVHEGYDDLVKVFDKPT